MRYLCLAALVVCLGCAKPPIKKQDVPALARADARVLDGCYDCLLEARSIYERIGVGKARPLVIARLFETQLLIALREKEFAVESAPAFAKAAELARELPPAAEADQYLALAAAVPPDNIGTPRREMQAIRRPLSSFTDTVDARLAWLKAATALSQPARQYLALAVDCANLGRRARLQQATGDAPADGWTGSFKPIDLPDAPPLVAYRAAMCDDISVKALDRVRDKLPEFRELGFFLARPEVRTASATGGGRAHALLDEALLVFPESASINYLTGNLKQEAGDCVSAMGPYDKTLALKPAHEDAMLGRTTCLSFLKRRDEAIAQATQMIDQRTDNVAEAYYWRAFNLHAQESLPAARADVERAKTMKPRSSEAFALAGIIEHDQNELPTAENDLKRSLMISGRQCVAAWYLGLVRFKQERWPEAAGDFEASMKCYQANVGDDERQLRAIEARNDLDPEFKARKVAVAKAALEEDRGKVYASAFNAANQWTRGGEYAKARTLVELAAPDPELAAMVAELQRYLKDK